jgi:hypothetical protein
MGVARRYFYILFERVGDRDFRLFVKSLISAPRRVAALRRPGA